MVIHSDLSRIKTLLTEALTVLCKNGLKYRSELCIEGLLGITLDNKDIFLVNINEKLVQNYDEIGNNKQSVTDIPSCTKQFVDENKSSMQKNDAEEPSYYNSKPEEVFRDTGHCISNSSSNDHQPSQCHQADSTGMFTYASEGQVHFRSSETISTPLDLIIKRENLSDGENGEEISEISRHFNISRPNYRIKRQSKIINNEPLPQSEDGHIQTDPKSLPFTENETKLADKWTSRVAPYYDTSNIGDPHFFALNSAPLNQAFPLLGQSLINQYNIGIQIPPGDNTVSPITPSRNSILSGRTLVCQFCAKVVRTNQALRDHIATHEQRKRYQCQNCDLQFVHRSSLANHRRKCLPSVTTIETQWFRTKEEKT